MKSTIGFCTTSASSRLLVSGVTERGAARFSVANPAEVNRRGLRSPVLVVVAAAVFAAPLVDATDLAASWIMAVSFAASALFAQASRMRRKTTHVAPSSSHPSIRPPTVRSLFTTTDERRATNDDRRQREFDDAEDHAHLEQQKRRHCRHLKAIGNLFALLDVDLLDCKAEQSIAVVRRRRSRPPNEP